MMESDDRTGVPACWVLSPGHAGMENQAIGLAERLGTPFAIRRVRPRAPWTWLPVTAWPAPMRALGPDSDALSPPWPELLIASGRRAIPYAVAIRRASGGRCFCLYLQDPRIDPRHFDLVVPPAHDGLAGANVEATLGALHRITPARLAEAADRWRGSFAALPRPLAAVMLGGSNKVYRLTPPRMRALGESLAALARREGIGLAVTASRRTGADNLAAFRAGLGDTPAKVWDGVGDNPYFGMLALAEHLLVTADSVSMASEAVATGKPVHVLELDGDGGKFARFHADLRRRGYARSFDGSLPAWTYAAPDEPGRIAAIVRERLADRRR